MTQNTSRLGVLRASRVGFLTLAVLATGCSEAGGRRRPGAGATIPVTVARAEQRDVPFEISAPGTVEALQAVAVTAQVTGVITEVRFREGDEVKAGRILVQIDSRPYRNALQQAEATLARDLAQLTNARRQVDRYRGLAQNEVITSEQLEALRTAAEALDGTVKSDSAAVDNARLNLEYTTIRAPISGRTGSLLIKEANLVRAQGAGPLVIVNQIRPILVRFSVPSSFLPVIRERQGDRLTVRVASASGDSVESFQGELTFVDNAVDTTTGTIMLKGHFANAEGALWPGQFVTTTLVLYEEKGVVLVPTPAVVESEGGTFVYVVGPDSAAVTRPVKTGRSIGEYVVVTEGLKVGEVVVTDGQLRLTPGARVSIRRSQS